jgi:hypothetical protein
VYSLDHHHHHHHRYTYRSDLLSEFFLLGLRPGIGSFQVGGGPVPLSDEEVVAVWQADLPGGTQHLLSVTFIGHLVIDGSGSRGPVAHSPDGGGVRLAVAIDEGAGAFQPLPRSSHRLVVLFLHRDCPGFAHSRTTLPMLPSLRIYYYAAELRKSLEKSRHRMHATPRMCVTIIMQLVRKYEKKNTTR